ncbi:hypothetical protein BUALT_Bualt01G0050300 [Buddleja alternifolia]|uniref:DOG1 domain-containing protein n=1 Tax=Buddleja alternifolia TaxID=168488 RepID=A0AAV6Y6T2_9LAMI|nr:hypothetical protein BUALT_Bualt01G0050300 [Buddleja alternifolia]
MVNPTTHVQSFESFFECWLISQENYLRDLLRLVEGGGGDQNYEVRCEALVGQVMDHYDQYFGAKARIVHEDVFLVFTPTWFSSFERTYLWIGGFRPGLAFRLVMNNVLDLTDDQSRRINRLMAEIKGEENGLTDELTRVQGGMTSPSMVELARHLGRHQNGAAHNMESAVERLRASMEALVECADFLRRKTGINLVEILKPSQAVRFLAATAQLQLRLRRWGMQRDAQNQTQRNF